MSAIFVSYTSTDRTWAHGIAEKLRALGHAEHVHEQEIGAGHDIMGWMEDRRGSADPVLCVVSEEYLNAPYSTMERRAAVWRAVRERRPDAVLFVVVKPCALPALVAHFRRCELFNLPEDAARTDPAPSWPRPPRLPSPSSPAMPPQRATSPSRCRVCSWAALATWRKSRRS